jgi:hypothetical protein
MRVLVVGQSTNDGLRREDPIHVALISSAGQTEHTLHHCHAARFPFSETPLVL